MASSESGLSVVTQIREFVQAECPQLNPHIDTWLACYRDPRLLLLSLQKEYEIGLVDSSDEEMDGEPRNTRSHAAMSSSMSASPPICPGYSSMMLGGGSSSSSSGNAGAGLLLPTAGSVPAAADGTCDDSMPSGHPDEDLAKAIALSLDDSGPCASATSSSPAPAALQAAAAAEGRAPQVPTSTSNILAPSGRSQRARERLYKVRLCTAWQRYGRCQRGLYCTFAHGDDERQYWQSTRQNDTGSGMSTLDEAEACLQRLCGRWCDQSGSSYTLASDGPDTLGVSTMTPAGERTTAAWIRLEKHPEIGRARVVWGGLQGRCSYFLDAFASDALTWKNHLSDTSRWSRENSPRRSSRPSDFASADPQSKRPRHSSFMTMRPLDIGFCHDTISPRFRDGRAILHTLLSLVEGKTQIRDMPMMQVVQHGDGFFSISNRRLCLYRLCELLGMLTAVKVELLESYPPQFQRRFTTPCAGAWARVRRDGRICGRTLEETTFGQEELFG